MWIDDIPAGRGWTFLWGGRILCGCGGIRAVDVRCPACDATPYDCSPQTITMDDGRTFEVAATFMGAEGRYEDYLYLHMMEHKWTRATAPGHEMLAGVSEKASVVLLFWTYFETRIERLLRIGLRGVPVALAEDALERYSSIGARLDTLYRVLFGTTYEKDLKDSGHLALWSHLKHVQKRRNEFIHGNPKAIDDTLVNEVVAGMRQEHEAWIDVFNRRIRASRAQQPLAGDAPQAARP